MAASLMHEDVVDVRGREVPEDSMGTDRVSVPVTKYLLFVNALCLYPCLCVVYLHSRLLLAHGWAHRFQGHTTSGKMEAGC